MNLMIKTKTQGISESQHHVWYCQIMVMMADLNQDTWSYKLVTSYKYSFSVVTLLLSMTERRNFSGVHKHIL